VLAPARAKEQNRQRKKMKIKNLPHHTKRQVDNDDKNDNEKAGYSCQ